MATGNTPATRFCRLTILAEGAFNCCKSVRARLPWVGPSLAIIVLFVVLSTGASAVTSTVSAAVPTFSTVP